eukprot:Hpha_TRINITY_DN14370_c1_g1::TRINITY_DN14370_c1_g1_i1::g.87167::m.87167
MAKGKAPQSAPESLPWAKDEPLNLDDELLAFGDFMAPSHEEKDRTRTYLHVLQEVVRTLCNESYVRLIGSRMIGVALPFSGYDSVVEGWPTEISAAKLAKAISQTKELKLKAKHVSDSQLVVSWTFDPSVPPLENIVLLRPGASPEYKLCLLLDQALGRGMAQRAVVLVMRTRLCQQRNFELSGTAVAVLVAALAKGEPAKPGDILYSFLSTYGKKKWAEESAGIGVFGMKVHPDPVSIVNPYDSSQNLGANCRTSVVFSSMLLHAEVAMKCAARKRATNVLESIIGYQRLVRDSSDGRKHVVLFKDRAEVKKLDQADEKRRHVYFNEPLPADVVAVTGGCEHRVDDGFFQGPEERAIFLRESQRHTYTKE